MTPYRIERLGPGAGEALRGLREHGGVVVAVFERTVNLRADNGRLLALHIADVPMTPFSALLVERPPIWPAAAAPASATIEALQIGSLYFNLPDCVHDAPLSGRPWAARPSGSATGASQWTDTACPLLERWTSRSAFGRWWLDEHIQSEALLRGPGFESAIRTAGGRWLRRLVDALRRGDEDAIWLASRALLGLGPGLTPSGDDVLVGLFAAWQRLPSCTLDPSLGEQLLTGLAGLAMSATTPLSAEFFYHLARGRMSEPLDTLIAALGSGDAIHAAVAADTLAGWGHTSGLDLIAGILALALAARKEEPPWKSCASAFRCGGDPGLGVDH